jgi:hypothetical protein
MNASDASLSSAQALSGRVGEFQSGRVGELQKKKSESEKKASLAPQQYSDEDDGSWEAITGGGGGAVPGESRVTSSRADQAHLCTPDKKSAGQTIGISSSSNSKPLASAGLKLGAPSSSASSWDDWGAAGAVKSAVTSKQQPHAHDDDDGTWGVLSGGSGSSMSAGDFSRILLLFDESAPLAVCVVVVVSILARR